MINQKPKIIVFDVGGVLVDWRVAVHSVARELDVSIEEFHTFLKKYLPDLELGKILPTDFWEKVRSNYQYKGESRKLSDIWIKDQPVIEESWNLLKKLIVLGYRVAGCTNSWMGTMDDLLEVFPEFKTLEFIVDSSVIKVRKPDYKIYRIVEKVSGEKGSNLLLIDDSQENIEKAKEFGWQVQYFELSDDLGSKCSKKIYNFLS